MLVIAGDYNLDKNLGAVADRCPICGEITILRVTKLVRLAHAYFIPVGARRYLGAIMACGDCGGTSPCEQQKYAGFVPYNDAKDMEIGEVMLRTNPRLAEAISRRALLEQELLNADGDSCENRDLRVALALVKIADLDPRDLSVIRLQASLMQWNSLDALSQSKVLSDIDVLAAQKERTDACAYFINRVAQQFKPELTGLFVMLPFAAPLIPGISLSMVFLNANAKTLATGVALSFFPSLVFGLIVNRFILRQRHKRFFRTILLPEAECHGIQIRDIIEMLDRFNVAETGPNENLRSLARAMPLLKEVLAEQNRYLEASSDDHAAAASR